MPIRDLRERVLSMMRQSRSFSESDAAAINSLIDRGMTLNNPKISLRCVRAQGHRLMGDEPATEVRRFADAHPTARLL